MRRLEKSGASAFTLLELLVAVTITFVLAGLILGMVTNILSLWHRTQDGFTTSSQAAITLDMIERDLQAAVFRVDGQTWFAVDVINVPASLGLHGWLTPSTMKPATGESQRLVPDLGGGAAPLIGDARFGLSGTWLRFVATNVESDGSLPVAVSYQIARRPVSGAVAASNLAEVRYTLFRSAISTAGAFTLGNEITASGYSSTSVTPTASRNPKTLMNPNNADAMATNVVDFGVWLYVHDAATGGLRRIYPADNDDLSHAARDSGVTPDANRFPDVVDVMVRVLSDEGAALLTEVEGGGHLIRPTAYASDADWWWGVVETHSKVYFRRIAVAGASQ